MPRRPITTINQKECMVAFMERNHLLVSSGRVPCSDTVSRYLDWNAIRDKLNSIGPAKDLNEWRVYWRNLKHAAKAKAARIRHDIQEGTPINLELVISSMDERIMKIVGIEIVNGIPIIPVAVSVCDDESPSLLENAKAKPEEVETPIAAALETPAVVPSKEDYSGKAETQKRSRLTERRRVSTHKQKERMVEIMKCPQSQRLDWTAIRDELNSIGPSKDVHEWRVYWRNVKCATKIKADRLRQRGSTNVLFYRLSKIEEDILAIMGVHRIANIPDANAIPAPKARLERTISDTSIDDHSCRVCLVASAVDMEFLFSANERGISLAKQISQCSEIPPITRNDGFAQYICGVCKEMLEVATKFRELCQKSDAEMRTMQHRNEINVGEYEEEEYLMEEVDEDDVKFETIYTSVSSPYLAQVVTAEKPPEDHKTSNELSRSENADKLFKSKITPTPQMETTDLPSSDIQYSCLQCNRSFRRELNLRIHVKNHSKPALAYPCEHCGKMLKSIRILKMHMKTHLQLPPSSSDKSYPCSQCDKSFNRQENLRFHLKVHCPDRPFVCEICGKTFKYRNHIKEHLKNHQHIRDFACSSCPYRTGIKQSLKIHERIHTGQRPFECPVCSLTFTTASNRIKHVRTIHEKRKDHACEICGRKFYNGIAVRRHMAVHSNTKKFVCEHCPNVYGHSTGLRRHIKKHHPELHQTKVRKYV